MLAYDLSYMEKDLYFALRNQLEEVKASLYKFMKSVDKEIVLSKPNYMIN